MDGYTSRQELHAAVDKMVIGIIKKKERINRTALYRECKKRHELTPKTVCGSLYRMIQDGRIAERYFQNESGSVHYVVV